MFPSPYLVVEENKESFSFDRSELKITIINTVFDRVQNVVDSGERLFVGVSFLSGFKFYGTNIVHNYLIRSQVA